MGHLVTDTDLAAEDIVVAGADAQARLAGIVDLAEAYIERETGYRFYAHTATHVLDGTEQEDLVLPQPIITLTSLVEDGTLLTPGIDYLCYNRRPPGPDDRRLPYIARVSAGAGASIPWGGFGTRGTVTWPKGWQNIVLSGLWGYTDNVGGTTQVTTDPVTGISLYVQYAGGSEVTPPEIKRACLRLVALELARLGVEDEQVMRRIRVFATSLGHSALSASLAQLAVSGGGTHVPEIDDVLVRYTHPRYGRRPLIPFGGA